MDQSHVPEECWEQMIGAESFLPHSPSDPSCPAQTHYALTWDSLLLCPQLIGMSNLKCHSILGWDHLSPSWYPALIHRVEQALSQRALDRDPKVVLGPQPTALELLEENPCAKPQGHPSASCSMGRGSHPSGDQKAQLSRGPSLELKILNYPQDALGT